jgi:hypothetical protein
LVWKEGRVVGSNVGIVLTSLLLTLSAPAFLPPQPWALNFAAPPRIPMVGDVNADGFADLIVVYPPGGSIVDLSLNVAGQKAGRPFQGLNPWGRDCQAAAVGEMDDAPGADVVGIFGGKSIRIAGGFKDGKLQDRGEWLALPEELASPRLDVVGAELLTWCRMTGRGFRIDRQTKAIRKMTLPKGAEQVVALGDGLAFVSAKGEVRKLSEERDALRGGQLLGRVRPGSRIAALGGRLVLHDPAPGVDAIVPVDRYAPAPAHYFFADMDKDGDLDLVEFRNGEEKHTRWSVVLHRQLTPGETDPDHDGLTNEEEARLGTDPHNPDTDGDGLLDGWEVKGHRGLDLPGMGANPRRMDIICLVSRFDDVDEQRVKSELERAVKTYSEIEVTNPDGSKGWTLHIVHRDPITGDDKKNPWGVNRDKFLPAEWRGLVRWMQVTPGGGGQANQLGDGGSCGVNALWAVFLHEFGHQLGMNHEGWWGAGHCPIYTSLMNYAYSYSVEEDPNKIRYSDGRLAGYVLNETRLDETIPLPYEQVKFLEKAPYRFRLKPNGDTTLVDWNWNGIFGEKNIRADINYSYSTNAGERHDIGKIHSAPWLFTHRGAAYALYGVHGFPGDVKTDPTISPEKPGELLLRRLEGPKKWGEPIVVEAGGLVGDPVGISHEGDEMLLVYATKRGVQLRRARLAPGLTLLEPILLDADPRKVPTVGQAHGRVYVFLWNPATREVTYRTFARGTLSPEMRLYARSTIPPGMTLDTVTGEIVLGMAQDQDDKRPSRWQVRRYSAVGDRLGERSWEWIEGVDGGARGLGRCTLLFAVNRDTGPAGRLYFFGKGMHGAENPWACTFVAESIADKTVRGGWLVKRYYDEWTQSRSAPAACWYGGDILWSYRWVDASQGDRDNVFHIGYRASGIEDVDMGDHDDISFFRDFGIRYSIWWMNP